MEWDLAVIAMGSAARPCSSERRVRGAPPGPGLPGSPIAPPSVFQGPRFMTSEYNSKYLKEPSNQPGRHISELMPPSHHTSLSPTPRRDTGAPGAGTGLRRHQ